MKEWTEFQLGDVCAKIGSGATPRGGSSVYLDHGTTALIRSQNVYNDGFHHDGLAYLTETHARELANVEVQRGDILLNITGDSVARACQVDPGVLPARVNQHVAIIRPDPRRLDPLFLRYHLVSPGVQARMLSLAGAGATRNALTKGMIEAFKVPAPEDVTEQQAIAGILGALDDKIELNRRRNRTLEELARAIFRSWFVDFDPVTAKAAGRATAGLSPAVAALFPDAFADSELGPIPNGWRVAKLGEYCEKITDGSHRSPASVDNGLPMASVKDMTDWGITVDTCRRIAAADFESLVANDCCPKQGDVLLAKDGATCLETAVEYRQTDKIVLLSSVAILRPHKLSDAAYLHLWLTDAATKHYLREGFVSGSAIPRVVLKDLKRAMLLHPPADVMTMFHHTVEPLRESLRANVRASMTLAALRDALLPKLVSGALRVTDAERIVGRMT